MSKLTEFDNSSDYYNSTDTNSEIEIDKGELVNKGKDETYVNEDLYDYDDDDDELRLFLEQRQICTDEQDDYDFSFLENQLWLQKVLHNEYDNTHRPYCFNSVREMIHVSPDEPLIPSSSLRRGASVTDSPHEDREYIREGGTKRPEKRRSELDGAHELEVYMHTDTKPDNKCNKGLISAGTGLPVIQIETDCYFFHTGETFLIPVTIHANPAVSSLRWEKNLNGEITTIDMSTHGIVGCIPNNPSLEIISTKISDRGRYTCIASNAFGESRSNEVIAFIIEDNEKEIATPELSDQVNTPDHESYLPTSETMRPGPPELTIKKDQYSVSTGESVTLECIVYANPPVGAIRWTRNLNGAITEIDNKSTRFSGNKPSYPSLIILSTSITDQGCYTCFASNFLGEKRSRQIVLYIQKVTDQVMENRQSPRTKSKGHKDRELDNRPTTQPKCKAQTDQQIYNRLATPSTYDEKPKIDVEAVTYVVRCGFPVSLIVFVTAYPEVEHVYWTKKNGEIITKLSFGTQRIRCSIDDPSLKIEISKTTDAGVYKCCAKNSAGTGFSIDISLIVNGQDDISEETITCISQHLGDEWRNIMIKLGAVKEEDFDEISEQYPENTPSQIKECLNRFIRNKKENPDLIYHLIDILDSYNRKDLVDEVRQQLDSPLITMKQRRCTSKLGNTIEVACDVRSSSSISRIYWTKNTDGNSKTIHQSLKGFNGITIDNPSLVLDNVRQTDEGVYECFAENEAGVGRGDAVVVTVVSDETADSDIPIVEIRFKNYKVELGQSVTLQCTIHSIQDIVSVIWMKQTTETNYSINSKSPGMSGSTPDKPSLTIKSVSMTDIGSYVCCASNDVGIGNSKPIKLEFLEGIVKSSLTVNKTTISIKEGDLFNEDVEAVAVITNPTLNLSERYISKNISRIIGKTLQDEVTKHYPNGVQHGTTVVATVENLRCKSILLYVLDDGLNDQNIKQAQITYLHNCLTEATKKGVTSIALPTCYILPDGELSKLSIRALVSSQFLFLKDYIKENYNTTLTDIRIIIDKREYDIMKEFEEAARTIKVTGVPVVLQKFKDISVKYLSVKLCHGDIENFDVDVIVHYVTPLINQNANELSVSLFKIGGLEFQRLFDEKVFKKYSNKIAAGQLVPCEGGKLKCERVYNCCLSETNPLVPQRRQKTLEEICEDCLKFAHTHGRKSIAFPFWVDHAFDALSSYKHQRVGIRKFVEKNLKSSLKEVFIVIRGRRTTRTIKVLEQTHALRDKCFDPADEKVKDCIEMCQKEIFLPQNWISYSLDTTVKNLKVSNHASHRMVELSKDNKLYKAIAAIWEDSSDDSSFKELKRIERLESLTLWEDYAFKRSKLFLKASTMRGCFPGIEQVPDSGGQMKTMARQQSCLLQQLSSNINEVYLFCLSSDRVQVDSALVNGVAMRKDKFGYGVYFTDKLHLVDANSSDDEDTDNKMILARVSLGEMCVLQRENEDMSFPPCKVCNFDNCVHGRRYDSVIGCSKNRNFIIYERSQAYPEYIITYE